MNKRPPPAPVSHQSRNQVNNYYGNRGRPAFTLFNQDSSSEDSSESDSDVTSSDSSDGDYKTRVFRGGNYGRPKNKLLTKNGANSGLRTGSAKINDKNKRGFHTQRNISSPAGSMTGRSVKSESAITATLSKRRLENNGKPPLPKDTRNNSKPRTKKESFNASTKNSNAKTTELTEKMVVTQEEKDKVLKKYGLSPLPASDDSKKGDVSQTQKVKGLKLDITNGKTEKNSKIKTVKSDSAIASGYAIEDFVKRESTGKCETVEGEETLNSVTNGYAVLEKSEEQVEKKTENGFGKKNNENEDNTSEDTTKKKTAWHNEDDSTDKILHMLDSLNTADKPQKPSPSGQLSSRSSDNGSVRASRSKILTDKAARSFTRFANLTSPDKIVSKFSKKDREKGYKVTLKDKPFTSGRPRIRKSNLNTVNPVPYGYARRQANKVKGIGPFHRISVRALNSSIDYKLEDALRSGSADIPKISYRHKIDTPQTFAPQQLIGMSKPQGPSPNNPATLEQDNR